MIITFPKPRTQLEQDSWIPTVSGLHIHPLHPDPSKIRLVDIAWALSKKDRYTCHTKFSEGYTVAQHSIIVSQLVSPAWALAALMHDCAEYALPDIAGPIKHAIAGFSRIEFRLQAAVWIALELPYIQDGEGKFIAFYPDEVKQADKALLANEERDVMNPCDRAWNLPNPPIPGIEIKPMSQQEVFFAFIDRYVELSGKPYKFPTSLKLPYLLPSGRQ